MFYYRKYRDAGISIMFYVDERWLRKLTNRKSNWLLGVSGVMDVCACVAVRHA